MIKMSDSGGERSYLLSAPQTNRHFMIGMQGDEIGQNVKLEPQTTPTDINRIGLQFEFLSPSFVQ